MQSKTTGPLLRDILLNHPDGLSVKELSKISGIPYDTAAAALRRTFGCYVASRIKKNNRIEIAIWKCVVVPENAPELITRDAPRKKPKLPEYKPQKTTWASVPSWSSVKTSA